MKILLVDFEMSNLNADYGMLLCGVVRELGGKEQIFRIDQYETYKAAPWNDGGLAVDLRNTLEASEIIVTWNGKRFDVPFLNSRLLFHGYRTFEPQMHLDLLYVSKYKQKISSNSLDNVARFLRLKEEKTRISGENWTKAMTGNKEALNYIVEHCRKDVQVLGSVMNKLKGLVKYIQ